MNKYQSSVHENMDRFDPREQPAKQEQAEEDQPNFDFDVVGKQPPRQDGQNVVRHAGIPRSPTA